MRKYIFTEEKKRKIIFKKNNERKTESNRYIYRWWKFEQKLIADVHHHYESYDI